jgi:hypothetical protein
MQVDVAMSPEKNEGQGFGIPGSPLDGNTQNADIYISGVGSPVRPAQVLTGVFKPNTYMTLSIVGSTFKVTAHNDVDADTLSLQGTVAPNLHGGAGIVAPL